MQTDAALLHHYRRGVLTNFILSLAVFVAYIALTPNLISSGTQKIVGVVWLFLYSAHCLYLRSQVPERDTISNYRFPIFHWVVLGLVLVYSNVVKPSEFQNLFPIINTGFILFALFSADAHWDFKKLTK